MDPDCEAYWNGPVECPGSTRTVLLLRVLSVLATDGIGPNGVGVLTESGSYAACVAWDSPEAARGFMECSGDFCTKIKVSKENGMSRSVGVFLAKRFHCSEGTCNVYKVCCGFETVSSERLNPAFCRPGGALTCMKTCSTRYG